MLDVALADPDSQDVRALATKLRTINRQSVDVVDALLDLADLDHSPVHAKGVALSALLREVTSSVAAEAESAAVHVSLMPGADCAVQADPTLLRQLVLNLLHNAVRHNIPQGAVTVTTVMHTGSVTVRVWNTGPPIAPHTAPLLTEPFYRGAGRTNRGAVSQGRGLGLALAASIATAHGTQLTLTANPDGGLTAQFDLPTNTKPRHPAPAAVTYQPRDEGHQSQPRKCEMFRALATNAPDAPPTRQLP